MKKFVMFAFVAATALSFVACNTKSGDANATSGDSTAVTTTTEVTETVVEGSALVKYEELINKAIEIYPKVKAGDAAAAGEYTKLAQEMAGMSDQLQKEMANMSADEAAKFAELGKKLQEAMTK